MPSQLESRLQASVVKWAKDHDILAVKVHEKYQPGFPDRMFIGPNGDIIWLEFKAEGKKPTPLQLYIHQRLASRNHRVYTVTTRHESIQHLQDLLATS